MMASAALGSPYSEPKSRGSQEVIAHATLLVPDLRVVPALEFLSLRFPSKGALSENGDRLLGRDLTARDALMHSFRLRSGHIAFVLQAPNNARGVARPLGGAARDLASRNHPFIIQGSVIRVPASILPKILEPLRAELGISHRVRDVPVPEVLCWRDAKRNCHRINFLKSL
jgi:hypothetical protein